MDSETWRYLQRIQDMCEKILANQIPAVDEKREAEIYNLGFEHGQQHMADYINEVSKKMRQDMARDDPNLDMGQ